MKFFIFVCCTAHLLLGTSSLRVTTPMSSAVRSREAEERRVAKFAEMINFVNSALKPSNDFDERRIFSRHDPYKREISRPLKEMIASIHGHADLKEFHPVDIQPVVKEIEKKVRYHVIDNPEVLIKFRNKQKKINNTAKDQQNADVDVLKFSTTESKMNYTNTEVTSPANPKVTSQDNTTVHITVQEVTQVLTTNGIANRRSFLDDKDDEKLTLEFIKLKIDQKENNKSKKDEEQQYLIKTDDFGKETQDNKHSSKRNIAQIDKKKIVTKVSEETAGKPEDNKRYRPTQFIYSQEKQQGSRISPKYEDDVSINKEDIDTNENSGKNRKEKGRTGDNNAHNLTSVKKKPFNEQYSIYSHKALRENSNEHSKQSHEKEAEYDKTEKDKYHDKKEKRESAWIKVDDQKDYKEILRNKNDGKRGNTEGHWDTKSNNWGSKERDWDKNNDKRGIKEKVVVKNYAKEIDDRWSKKGNDRESKKKQKDKRLGKKETDWGDIDDRFSKEERHRYKNEERFTKKEKYWDKSDDRSSKKEKTGYKNDDEWIKKEKYWNNKKRDRDEKNVDTMEFEWNKRHQEYDEHKNNKWQDDNNESYDKEFKERDVGFKNMDDKFNIRDNDWTKRNSGGNKNVGRNEPEIQQSYESVNQNGYVRPDRYKIVERIDAGSSRNDGYNKRF